MTDVWVTNASPVITLARVGALRLLEREDVRVVVPAEVVGEILADDRAAVRDGTSS